MGSRRSLLSSCVLFLLIWQLLDADDCNRNGIEDLEDLKARTSLDCNRDEIPDECGIRAESLSLKRATTINVGNSPGWLEARDLDGDGDADLAVVLEASGSVATFLRNGSLRLVKTSEFVAGAAVRALAAADLDGDQDLDLLAAGVPQTFLLENQLAGVFKARGSLANEREPLGVHAGDLDGDGDLDAATVGNFKLEILRNVGQFRFEAWTSTTIGSNPSAVRIIDLEGDGRAEVVTRNLLGNVSVIKNEAGELKPPRNYAVAEQSLGWAIADLDGDGDSDLAVSAPGGSLSILLQTRAAEFGPGQILREPTSLFGLDVFDPDADGDVDIVASTGRPELKLFLNRGNGHFFVRRVAARESSAMLVSTAELNDDGIAEVITAERGLDRVGIWERELVALSRDCQGDGIPDECQLENADCNRNSIPDDCDLAGGVSPDCNHNGRPDECDIGSSGASFQALEPVTDPGVVAPFPVATVDGDGDGDFDAVISGQSSLRFYHNRGDGQLSSNGSILFEGLAPTNIAVGDLNGDGIDDLAGAVGIPDGILPLLSSPGRVYTHGELVHIGGLIGFTLAGDIDGDARLDLLGTLGESGNAVWLRGDGSGRFSLHEKIHLEGSPFRALLQDLDQDGDLDVAAVSFNRVGVALAMNAGRGRFVPPVVLDLAVEPPFLATLDADLDGDLDLAGFSAAEGGVLLAMNLGMGAFGDVRVFLSSVRPLDFLVADLDDDSDPDITLAVFDGQGTQLLSLYNHNATLDRHDVFDLGAQVFPTKLLATHLDGDDRIDLVLGSQPLCADCAGPFRVGEVQVLLNTSAPPTSLDQDGNKVPDECQALPFFRGDVNADGSLNLTDAVAALSYLFQGGGVPDCFESSDADNNGRVDLTDAVVVLDFLFRGGPAPANPGPPGPELSCGRDPDGVGSPADLGCVSYTACP